MRFRIINDIKDENLLVAGRPLDAWTKDALKGLPEGNDALLIVKKYAPLLSAGYLENLAKTLRRSGARKAKSEVFTVIIPQGKGTLTIERFSTKRITEFSLPSVEKALYKKIALYWIGKGVKIPIIDNVYIDYGVRLEKGSIVYPFNILKGRSVVKENAVLYYSNVIDSSEIGKNSVVKASFVFDSRIGENCSVGPFAYLRQNAVIGDEVRVGDFVEIKNSRLRDRVKSAHLTYIGDADVGENTNVGCGTVFANYDGKTKHKTTVGKNVFIGCNTNLIAPLTVGDDSFIAGGSTVTEDVSDNTFVVARTRQTNKKKIQKK